MSSSSTTVDQPPVFRAAASIHRQGFLVAAPLVRKKHKKDQHFLEIQYVYLFSCLKLDENIDTTFIS